MLSAVLSSLTEGVSGFMEIIVSLFEGMIGIFYDSTASALTEVGILAIFAFAVAVVFFGFRVIFRLMHLRG